ncbi:MAG: L,D-transpeptidase [Chloroflexota bacterium]
MTALLLISIAGVSTAVAQGTDQQQGADEPAFGLAAEVIDAYDPLIERVGVSDSILNTRDYRQVLEEVNVVDAPGSSNVLYHRARAEFFVSVIRIEGGWAEINPGEWIPASVLGPAYQSRLNGVIFPEGWEALDYPLAFTRSSVTFYSSQPGEEAPMTNANALAPYHLASVFDEVEIDGVLWYQIGVDMWLPAEEFNLIKPVERPEEIDTGVWIAVDIAEQTVMGYEGNELVFASLVATGHTWSPTEPGFWRVYLQYGHRLMTRGNPDDSWFYFMEDVPFTLYFNGDRALHGAYWHDAFGERQSHGCVNMSLNDSYWLWSWATDYMFSEASGGSEWPMVYVYDTDLPDLGFGIERHD